ncbi:MAG: membrane dipeptidase [Bdellovibrionota bacterium]
MPVLNKNKKRLIIWSVAIPLFVLVFIYSFLRFVFIPYVIDVKINGLEQYFSSQEAIQAPAFHKDLFIADLHADTLLWNRSIAERSRSGHVDIPRLIEGNIALQGFSIVTQAPRNISIEKNANTSDSIFWLAVFTGYPVKSFTHLSERALFQINKLRQAAHERDDFFIITNHQELEEYLKKRSINKKITAGWISVEGAQALDEDLTQLDRLFEAGVRMMSPAHLTDSKMSGSQQGLEKQGLTELGKKWLKKMDEKKMIIDLAHASTSTIDDVLELSERAPLVSHTGIKGACDNNRNLTDLQIQKIAKKGGLIGIGFWSEATCGSKVEDIVKSILYVKNLVGVSFVALGSDWDGYVRTPVDAARIGLLTAKLAEAGLSQSEVSQIMGANVLQFLLKNFP